MNSGQKVGSYSFNVIQLVGSNWMPWSPRKGLWWSNLQRSISSGIPSGKASHSKPASSVHPLICLQSTQIGIDVAGFVILFTSSLNGIIILSLCLLLCLELAWRLLIIMPLMDKRSWIQQQTCEKIRLHDILILPFKLVFVTKRPHICIAFLLTDVFSF
jgi:hypothetical protein